MKPTESCSHPGINFRISSSLVIQAQHLQCTLGLPALGWEMPEDFLRVEPGRVGFGERGESTMPPSKAAFFSWGNDLYCLEIDCTTGRSPGATWKLATLSNASVLEQCYHGNKMSHELFSHGDDTLCGYIAVRNAKALIVAMEYLHSNFLCNFLVPPPNGNYFPLYHGHLSL